MMSEWISVEDRVPDDGEIVTIYGTPKLADQKKVWGGVVFGKGKFWDFDVVATLTIGNLADFIEISDVTHWQPLPQPPK